MLKPWEISGFIRGATTIPSIFRKPIKHQATSVPKRKSRKYPE
jgi:transaldolase